MSVLVLFVFVMYSLGINVTHPPTQYLTCSRSCHLCVGLHSGPVTAGVLRGERSRFQLFGDTMNTASRMESTGLRNRVQVSQETADLLIASGKGSWIKPREEKVVAKGKGEMKTFWLELQRRKKGEDSVTNSPELDSTLRDDTSVGSLGDTDSDTDGGEEWEQAARLAVSAKVSRLIDWNVDVLLRSMKSVVSRRRVANRRSIIKNPSSTSFTASMEFRSTVGHKTIDELQNFIPIYEFDPLADRSEEDPEKVEIDASVEAQLYDYVSTIASMYKDKPFHNFEHASHVTMSTVKLLSRIVNRSKKDDFESDRAFHESTYGISSDPLAQFACIFGALIHDIDHPGVPNTQLAVEQARLAVYYDNRSIAEQNSIDLAWKLFLEDNYKDFRKVLCPRNDDLRRFRQLVVNIVLATDTFDEDLKKWRQDRWDKAFTEPSPHEESHNNELSRKATLVLEYLIQASNVAHVMQHWHIYRKWNECLFQEVYQAYLAGRGKGNPLEYWFDEEKEFLDSYVIPLAMKLKDCGVFGVSSDEYFIYAEKNRSEWNIRGRHCVVEMARKFIKPSLESPSMEIFNRKSLLAEEPFQREPIIGRRNSTSSSMAM
jgi:3'5'-cyclic nucleotide phosphodiesterase/Adenylate and Guanylate cyclase catalytic domain